MKNVGVHDHRPGRAPRKTLGKAVRVTIASNSRLKDERGEPGGRTRRWNEVTVFSPAAPAYIAEQRLRQRAA